VYDKLKSIYPKMKRVAIIQPDDPGARYPAECTVKEIVKHGMEVVSHETFKIPTEDFYPILTKALAQKPDSIEMIVGIAPWAKGIIKQARELGFTGPITSVAPVGDVNQIRNALNRNYAYDICMASYDVTNPKMPAMIRDFSRLVEKVSKNKMDFSHVFTLQALWIMVQGIEKAQSFDTDAVVVALENMKRVETPYGPGKMVGKDLISKNRLLAKDIPFTRIVTDGKMEFEFLPIKQN
jgi:branched-chain amino acid transport system substrate-binding protein